MNVIETMTVMSIEDAIKDGRTDFKDIELARGAGFSEIIFPEYISFERINSPYFTFFKNTTFKDVSFRGSVFKEGVTFEGIIAKTIDFRGTIFDTSVDSKLFELQFKDDKFPEHIYCDEINKEQISRAICKKFIDKFLTVK